MHKILVIDDNIFNIKIVEVAMTSVGYEVIKADNGIEGVMKAKTEFPDLVFMDVDMPIMNGIEAMKQIKAFAELKEIPVIAYTAHAMKGDKEKLLNEGFDCYLAKPISVSIIVDLACQYLGQTSN